MHDVKTTKDSFTAHWNAKLWEKFYAWKGSTPM